MSEISHHNVDLGDIELHYVTAGTGEPVVLLHGWPTTWYEWRHLIPLLADRYQVIAPDLRGLGDSSVPLSGYDKCTVARDVWRLLRDRLGLDQWCLVGHDMGGPVAYALAVTHPESIRRLALLDVGPPYVGGNWGIHWYQVFHSVGDLVALVQGKEAHYLRWFYDNIRHPSYEVPEEAVAEYLRTYTQPERLRAGFEYYRAITQDTIDNTILAQQTKLPMPVLAVQAAGPFAGFLRERKENHLAADMRPLAHDVREVLLANTGHWIPEEKPELLAGILAEFFSA